MRAVAVVTAAGSAERFGGKKLLTPIDGEPLLDHTIDALLDGGVAEVIVVVGRDARTELERARGIFVRIEARGIVEEIDRELEVAGEAG